jgi:DNA polymerase III epsilon subunit-like protein
MRFLQLKERQSGVRFDQPVLDTLLLSAVLQPNQNTHRLEAIAERLGVSVFGRHTALGDAMVTGEVFLKMLPLLAEMGITTCGRHAKPARGPTMPDSNTEPATRRPRSRRMSRCAIWCAVSPDGRPAVSVRETLLLLDRMRRCGGGGR